MLLPIIGLLTGPGESYGQHEVVLHPVDSGQFVPLFIQKETSLALTEYAQELRDELLKQGYTYASIDSMWSDSSSYHYAIYLGETISEVVIHYTLDSIATILLDTQRVYKTSATRSQRLMDSVGSSMIDTLTEQGYLLATVRMDSYRYSPSRLDIYNQVRSYQRLYFDSLQQTGKLKINYPLLLRLSGVTEATYFKPSMINTIEENLSNYEFIKLNRTPLIDIKSDGVDIDLDLNNSNVNQADVVIGFQPNDTETGKLLITGKADLRLVNSFGWAEQIAVSWQQLQTLSPRLIASFSLPFIANSNFGTSLELNYFKKDSSFRTLHTGISGDYSFGPRHSFSLYFQTDNSRIITVDTNKIKASDFKLDFIDYTKNSYGLRYSWTKQNRIINPTKGFSVLIDAASRTRSILPNYDISMLTTPDGQTYAQIYDSLNTNKWQGNAHALVDYLWPVRKQLVWYNRLDVHYQLGKDLFKNEMLQIGGLQTLRGYDEQSLYVQSYSLWLTEMRYILGSSGYLSAFFNTAYVDRYLSAGNEYQIKSGLGLGLSFFTGAGNFSLLYALGSNENNKIELRSGKIHLGYISKF